MMSDGFPFPTSPLGRDRIFDRFPVMDLGAFKLRSMREDDAAAYYEYHRTPEVARFMTDECLPSGTADALEEIRYNRRLFMNRLSFYWGLAESGGDTLIGSCGYNYWNADHSRAEISYDLSADYWGKGVATLMVNAALEFGFRVMGLNRVEATVPPDNERSLKLLKRLGFREEGLLRQQKKMQGRYYDMLAFSLLAEERDGR